MSTASRSPDSSALIVSVAGMRVVYWPIGCGVDPPAPEALPGICCASPHSRPAP
ncbi:MAG: hypothetical protein M3422_17130 [Actinomycetota bacterium]|nr:hypothetical protein [Actinomycetota bacterium]